jgi:hypothetical protein
MRAVIEYEPNNGIDDLLWDESEASEAPADKSKVVNLDPGTTPRPRKG